MIKPTLASLLAVLMLSQGLIATGQAQAQAQAQIPTQVAPRAAVAPAPKHRVVFQVSDNDPKKWELTMSNIRNIQADLGRDNVAVALVAYGPGLAMLTLDSPAANRVAEATSAGATVVACENTMHAQKLTREDMLSGIGFVKAGVSELMRLQEAGYSYIRP
jgi:intracellular sulfur oxidation DsrE/DsrF family protein